MLMALSEEVDAAAAAASEEAAAAPPKELSPLVRAACVAFDIGGWALAFPSVDLERAWADFLAGGIPNREGCRTAARAVSAWIAKRLSAAKCGDNE